MQSVRVFILADDLFSRTGMAAILGEVDSVRVVGHAAPTQLDSSLLEAFNPDVLLVEFGGDPEDWGDRWRSSLDSGMPTLFLGEWGRASRSAMRLAHQVSWISRDLPLATLVAALHAVAQGLSVSDGIEQGENELTPLLPAELTAREVDVIQWMAQGLTNRAIGQALSIKESTVKFHVNAILAKLEAQSRTEAVMRAFHAGLIKS